MLRVWRSPLTIREPSGRAVQLKPNDQGDAVAALCIYRQNPHPTAARIDRFDGRLFCAVPNQVTVKEFF